MADDRPFPMDSLRDVLDYYGVSLDGETGAIFGVLMDVVKKFNERNRVYGGVWRQYGALNNLIRAATKVDRLVALWWHGSEELVGRRVDVHKDFDDDAIDGIAYLAFATILARAGDWTGRAPRRPEGV